jgi:hypothetical protein
VIERAIKTSVEEYCEVPAKHWFSVNKAFGASDLWLIPKVRKPKPDEVS